MDTKQFRRELHANPELSFEEHKTAAFIAEQLSQLGIENKPIAKTGVLARIEGRRGNLKRCVVLRADKTVPVQYVVNVIDAVNAINNRYDTKHKVILATSPK